MGYSNKISQHIEALRHYLMAEAENGKPFNSEREKNYETNSTGLHGIRFAGVRFAFTAGDSGMQ